MAEDKRKVYLISIAKTVGTDLYVKADSEQEALDWVMKDVDWFDTEVVETNVKVDFAANSDEVPSGERIYDTEVDD